MLRKDEILREYTLDIRATLGKCVALGLGDSVSDIVAYAAQNIEDAPPLIRNHIYTIERFAGVRPLTQQLQDLETPQDDYECTD